MKGKNSGPRTQSAKYVVLLSGGLDSTYNLYRAVQSGNVVRAITFDYGQKAASAEIRVSKKLCRSLQVPHQVIRLPFFKNLGSSGLTTTASKIPVGRSVEIGSYARSIKTAAKVWVPNRNGVFLSVGAALAEGLGADSVVVGFNSEEAQTFPDNSKHFLKSMERTWSFSTQTQVKATCWSLGLDKTQIVARCRKLGVELSWMWPCYKNGKAICGSCESCQRFRRALGV